MEQSAEQSSSRGTIYLSDNYPRMNRSWLARIGQLGSRFGSRTGTVAAIVVGTVVVTATAAGAYAMLSNPVSNTATVTLHSTTDIAVGAALGQNSNMGFGPGDKIDMPVSVKNNYSRPLWVREITGNGAPKVLNGHSGCSVSAVHVVSTTYPDRPSAAIVAPGAEKVISVQVEMALNAADACQGAQFRLPVTVIGQVS